MLRLVAVADQISDDLEEQIRLCRDCGVKHIELRSVGGMHVLDFLQPVRAQIKARLDSSGIAVACIGAGVGRVPLSQPWNAHFDRFKSAIDAAGYFGALLVRIGSYSAPSSRDDAIKHRQEILRRMRAKVEHVTGGEITLIHQNEPESFGRESKQCFDLLQSVNSRALRGAFDFAGFMLACEETIDAWNLLKPFIAHFDVTDARPRDGALVAPGEGEGSVRAILADAYVSGYRGFLGIEPIPANAKLGSSAPQRFRLAVESIRTICRRADIPLAT